jgi:hypothetical protein
MSARQAELDREIQAIQRRISDLSARPLPEARPQPPRVRDTRPALDTPSDRPTPAPTPISV